MVRARVGRIGRGRGGQTRGGRRNGRGRGVLSSNASNPPETSEDSKCPADFDNFDFVGSFDKAVISIFTKQSSFKQHFDAQNTNRERYLAILLVVRSKSVELHDGSKCKALAAAWARQDYQLAQTMLEIPGEEFALKEVLKAVSILDAGRQKRQQEKVLRRLEAQGCRKKGKMAKLKSVIASLAQDIPPAGSLSGALIRHIKLWFKTIPNERLSFFAQHFPRDPWKKLADICHLHPENDIPQCPWFLHFVFGKEIPKEDENAPAEIVSNDFTSENISKKVLEFEIDYSVARKFKEHLTDEAKAKICSYAPINTVIWYFEELRCTDIDGILKRRLESGEKLSLSYGKLMERLQTFMEIKEQEEETFSTKECRTSTEKHAECHNAKALAIPKFLSFINDLLPIAEEQLGKLKLNIESPVVVIGDKSGSMQSAIRTSNIIASLLTKVASADLVFFDDNNVIPPFIPTTVEQVMNLSRLIQANKCTNPAASLYPYYQDRKIIKTFIIVTDEGENGKCQGNNFAQLFKKYYEEVYPADLVFISISSHYCRQQMINSLQKEASHIRPLCFELMEARPDLTKLDSIIGTLSLTSNDVKIEIDTFEQQIKEKGLTTMLESVKI